MSAAEYMDLFLDFFAEVSPALSVMLGVIVGFGSARLIVRMIRDAVSR